MNDGQPERIDRSLPICYIMGMGNEAHQHQEETEMKIHHATQKKADSLGISLAIMSDDQIDASFKVKRETRTYSHHDPKIVLALASLNQMLAGEYPRVEVIWDEEMAVFAAQFTDDEGEVHEFHESEEVPTLSDLLEAAAESELDIEAGYEEETGSIVKEKYKIEYAARGNANHCGDWLAQLLEEQCIHQPMVTKVDAEGNTKQVKGRKRFNLDRFANILSENGIEFDGKWAEAYLLGHGSRGWQGRFRMSGRLMLEKQVLDAGYIIIDGESVQAPEDWMEDMNSKHG